MTSDFEKPPVGRPGPLFDNAWRLLFAGRAQDVAAFVTGEPSSTFAEAMFAPTELAGTTLAVDALIETRNRRIHIELQLRANASEFEPRLVNYWARLNKPNLPALEQHVIVLNPRGGRLTGTYSHGALRLDYHAHHLWDQQAEAFLAHETLFPLAVLASAESTGKREAILQTVIDMAELKNRPNLEAEGTERTNRSDAASTISIAATLASIYLPRSTIRTILERNDTMTVLLRDFPLSQSFIEEGREEGRQEGREEGREEGRQKVLQAREEALSILLTLARVRHGELNHQVAERLTNSDRPMKELSEFVLQAANQEELTQLLETQN